MRMVFRWYGEGNDTVTLKQIKQIPGVEGVVWALHDITPGEEWPMDRILAFKEQVEKYGLHIDVVDSLNVHEGSCRYLIGFAPICTRNSKTAQPRFSTRTRR